MVGKDEGCSRRANRVLGNERTVHVNVGVLPGKVLVEFGSNISVEVMNVLRLARSHSFLDAATGSIVTRSAGVKLAAPSQATCQLAGGKPPETAHACDCKATSSIIWIAGFRH